MTNRVIKINIPMVFDQGVITALTGKTFEKPSDFSDYCQDTMYRMLKKACESSAIQYMMEVEEVTDL
jgi:hypothetical protein